MPSKLAILWREDLKEYDFGPGHPFRGQRYQRFPQFLTEHLDARWYQFISAETADDDDLLLICDEQYIEFTRAFYRAAHEGVDYNGRFSLYHSGDNRPYGRPGRLEEAARLIIGQAKRAADIVERGEFTKAVSLGGGLHHAKRAFGEGFCLYNDVAFLATYLEQQYGLERILILDTDAHAGNGTADYFYQEPRVLLIDLHQDPLTLYPGTGFVNQIGANEGEGYTVNVPLPVCAGYDSYKEVFEALVEPLAREFKPQIILRNGGSDPYLNDQLTQLGLPLEGFWMIGAKVRALAERCQGKEIDLIASGYNEAALPHAWLALISGLVGIESARAVPEQTPYRKDMVLDDTTQLIREVKKHLKDYWRCFR